MTGAAAMADTGNEHSNTRPDPASAPVAPPASAPRERPTPEGDALDPTRYGDWEKNGRCIDF
ncbi:MAG TPA: DUF1674 domain-containing protein [Rhodanobacteraceae bacterium]|nr:DUF1674 domain-containing protein [Rhodanobacteraceae bacterium]